MFEKNTSFFQLNKLLNVIFLLLGLLGLLGGACLMIVIQNKEVEKSLSTLQKKVGDEKKQESICLMKLHHVAFSLHNAETTLPIPCLENEILYYGKNTRPDANLDKEKILVGIKSSGEKKVVDTNEPFFLTYEEGALGLHFSLIETPLSVRVSPKNADHLKLDVTMRLFSEEMGKLWESSSCFTLGMTSSTATGNYYALGGETPFVLAMQSLKNAKWWAPDRLYGIYGGKNYKDRKGKERISFSFDERLLVHDVSPGDLLLWSQDGWKKVMQNEATNAFPLLKVLEASGNGVHVQLWDETGLETFFFSLPHFRPPALNIRMEEVFQRIRKRTSSRVSCRLQNKSAVLQKGDWLLHTSSTWRVLKNWDEIEQFLEYKNLGELFVFDGIEKKQGKLYFTGHLFNATRSKAQEIKLPLLPSHSSSSRQKKEEAISSKMHRRRKE